MINIKELRIGNLLYTVTNICSVYISGNQFVVGDPDRGELGLWECCGIELTNEILEKWCKFDIVKETSNNGKENIIRADFFIDVYTFLSVYPNNDIILTQIKEKKVYALHEMERIKLKPVLYLHQLQNLIYALTGQELTIKI